ncbi:MAG: aminopeptidase P family protein [Firmicutes bacterium]|nr:aminopeptidase P family protein [Bacillota bacterium]
MEAETDRDLYPRCSDAEFERRHNKLRKSMDERGLDCLLIYGGYKEMYQANAFWVTNYADCFQSWTVFPLQGEPALYNTLYPHLLYAKKVSVIRTTEWGGPSIAETVVKRVKELGLGEARIGLVGIDSRRTVNFPQSHYEVFCRELPGAKFEDATTLVEKIRSVKSAEEISFVEKGAKITDSCMKALVDAVRPGVTDFELYAVINETAYRLGGAPNFTLFASTSMLDPNMPYPWPQPSKRTVKKQDLISNELCANYAGYSGQLIRPIALGKPPKEFLEIYKIAEDLYHAIAGAIKPGNTEQDVINAVKPIAARGGFYQQAPLVHGWDNKPDRPWIGLPGAAHFPITPHVFEEGQLIMIEPNPCSLDLKKGIFLGSLHVVTGTGCRCLQEFPLEFTIKE